MHKTHGSRQNSETNVLWRYSVFLFTLAIIARITVILLLRPYHDLARFELERTALSLASSGVYGNPYAISTGPTAHVSPGYTVILASIFRLFGTGIPAEILKELLASLVSSVNCALVLPAAVALALGRRTGIIAGVVCALIPIKPLVQIDGDWEAPYTALFLLLACVTVAHDWTRRNLSRSKAVKNGILWGLALLFSSVLLPIFMVVLIAGFFFFQGKFRDYLAVSGIQFAVVLLCLLPWVVRNEISLGAPIATRSNFGLELHVSNNDQASPDQRVNYIRGVYDRFHPLQNEAEALKVRQMGEVPYNAAVLAQTKSWIKSHFERFLQLCAGRVFCFWFYPDPSRIKTIFGDLTAIFGLIGFWLACKNRIESGVLMSILLLLYPAPSYLIQVGARQRYPIDWLLTVLSAYVVVRVWESIRKSRSTPVKVAAG